jgi:hypothetical protein
VYAKAQVKALEREADKEVQAFLIRQRQRSGKKGIHQASPEVPQR